MLRDLASVARRLGAIVRSHTDDATGWRWRVAWKGIELAAWNDMDGVAVVADVGPWDDWVGLRGNPPDPTASEALEWAVTTLERWRADPAHPERLVRGVAGAGRGQYGGVAGAGGGRGGGRQGGRHHPDSSP